MNSRQTTTANTLQRHSRDLLASFVLATTAFLIAPLSVFQVNHNVMPFGFADAWQLYLLLAFAAFVALASLCIVFRGLAPYFSLIYIALGASFMIEGSFLVYGLGKLDGHPIQWDALTRYLPLEVAVWAGPIAVSLYQRRLLQKHLPSLAAVVMSFGVLSIVGAGSTFIASGAAESQRPLYDFEGEFAFSADKNVLIIVLDAFRSDVFAAIASATPETRQDFKDFTYYSNASGGYPTTRPSIPLILTGVFADNSVSMDEFLSSEKSQSLPSFLSEDGWVIEQYAYTVSFPSLWANLTSGLPKGRSISLVKKQLIVTAIRYMPLPLKPFFVDQYYQGGDYYHKNIVDFFEASDSTSQEDKPPTFKFIHLSGVHPPFQLNASLELADEGYVEQAKGNLYAVARLLREMKTAGVYDNSLIIVLGDHGIELPVPIEEGQQPSHPGSVLSISPWRIVSIATPLLLVKGFQQRQDSLAVSNAPASLSDIPKTVADALGMDNSFPGYALSRDIPEDRIRKFYYYSWEHSDWNQPYLPTLYEYEIRGQVSDIASWKFLYHAYTGDGSETEALPAYQYGTNAITALGSSNAWPLLAPGFEQLPRPQEGLWATGPVSCIDLSVERSSGSLSLSLEGFPFLVEGRLTEQAITIDMDQDRISSMPASASMSVGVSPASAAAYSSDHNIQLCFGFPDAQSPKSLGVNNDSRSLGYHFSSIVLREVGQSQ